MIIMSAALIIAGCKGGNKKAEEVPLPAEGEVAEAVEGAAESCCKDAEGKAGEVCDSCENAAENAAEKVADAVEDAAKAAEGAAIEAVDAIQAEVAKAAEAIEPDGTILYQAVEVKPTFKGGDANDFSKWVNKRINYPESAKKNGIEGRVGIQFTVSKDGSLKDIKVVQSADPALDAEALRVVKSSPKWTPGSQNGELADVKYIFPVVFKLAK